MNTSNLPHQVDRIFYTDGGLETTLIFHDGYELPHFAAFDLLKTDAGNATLIDYYRRYASIASEAGCGFVLETPTWRASKDWGQLLGYDEPALDATNRRAVDLVKQIRKEFVSESTPMVVSGNIGPRGDGYNPSVQMSAEGAAEYHRNQVRSFAESGVDMISAVTLNYVDEAIGVVEAAAEFGLATVISFTTETDGLLPTGETLSDAIEQVDGRTSVAPAYYMINCAHPEHFSSVLAEEDWMRRIRGVRANASRLSHAELDECEEIDAGDPEEFGQLHGRLKQRFSHLNVFGGCCGTDHRHVEAVHNNVHGKAA